MRSPLSLDRPATSLSHQGRAGGSTPSPSWWACRKRDGRRCPGSCKVNMPDRPSSTGEPQLCVSRATNWDEPADGLDGISSTSLIPVMAVSTLSLCVSRRRADKQLSSELHSDPALKKATSPAIKRSLPVWPSGRKTVHQVSRSACLPSQVVIKLTEQADHWTQLGPDRNRDSVRITSQALYSGGLFIIDLRLMPWGCGVWPACKLQHVRVRGSS